MRRVPLLNEGLYALRTLAAVLVIFGLATVAHGSGFLAVFTAGVLGARRGRGTRAARGASRSQGERAGAQWNLEPPAATLGW